MVVAALCCSGFAVEGSGVRCVYVGKDSSSRCVYFCEYSVVGCVHAGGGSGVGGVYSRLVEVLVMDIYEGEGYCYNSLSSLLIFTEIKCCSQLQSYFYKIKRCPGPKGDNMEQQ